MAKSNDNNLIGFIATTIETIRDQMATKSELNLLSDKLDASTTAIRGDIEQVHLRLDTIEHGMASRFEQVESELSRLRSAIYLLGKDRPDILRLLGQSNP